MKEIRDNAFRILALPADALEGEMLRQKARLDVMVRFGREISMDWNFPVKNGSDRDDGNVQAALDHLELPENRLNEAIFWFVNDERPDVLECLRNGDWAGAAALWRAALQETQPDAAHVATWHNFGSLQLLQAFESDTPDADLLAEGVHCKLQTLLGEGFETFAGRVHGPESPDVHAATRYFIDTLILRLREVHWNAAQIAALFDTAPEPWLEYVDSELRSLQPVVPPPAEEPEAEPMAEAPAEPLPEQEEESVEIPQAESPPATQIVAEPKREIPAKREPVAESAYPAQGKINEALRNLEAQPGDLQLLISTLKFCVPEMKLWAKAVGSSDLLLRQTGEGLADACIGYCADAIEAAEIQFEKEAVRNRPKALEDFLPVLKLAGTALQGIAQLPMSRETRIRLGHLRKRLTGLGKKHGRFTPSARLSFAPAAFLLIVMGVVVWRVWWHLG